MPHSEDDRDIRETMVDALEEEGYGVAGAVDGVEALERLRAMPAPPGVVLVDLMMPRENGMRLCEQMRSAPEWPRSRS